MIDHCKCPHQWIQCAPFIPAWVKSMPSPPVCPQPHPPITPNPIIPKSAVLPICTPLEIIKTGPCTLLVTVAFPAETIIELPTKSHEIKVIKKKFKVTQCQFFNSTPPVCDFPHDTPKLFIGGYVRKDIQYSEAFHQTLTTVEGILKDFVVEIPILCTVDLGKIHTKSHTFYSQQREYKFSDDFNESNILSHQFLNSSPSCELVYSQINEMDNVVDREPLPGGPKEEGVFRTIQEKMIILIQLRLTFPTEIDFPQPHCNDKPKNSPKTKLINLILGKND